ncbi:MFS transporter [Streptomyces sp. NPDC101733]|uniref:MFS transporter n=1 Tax=unclassified Streptomyces TaxID=2593676 RepID=UPI0038228953
MAETATLTKAPAGRASIATRLDRMPITPTHRKLTAVIGVGLLFDTFENHLSGTLAKVLQADFGFGSTELKLVLASAFIGQFVGSLTLGKIADKYGRRRAFLINLALYSGFSLLGAFSPNAAWLIATRFFAGIGIGAEQALSDCYLADVLPAKKRGRFIAWAYTLAFCGVPAVGFAALWIVPLSPLGVDGWRWLFIAGALGSIAVWVLRRRLIESPRWLAANGRTAEAEELVARMEAEVPAAALAESRAGDATAAATSDDTTGRTGTDETDGTDAEPPLRLRDVFRRGLRRRTVMLWVFCSLSVVGYYGFGTLAPQILAAKGHDIISGIGFTALSFLGYPVGSALAVPIIDRFERKYLIAFSAALMVTAGLGFAYADSAVLVASFGFAYTLCSNLFANASHVYLAEQYPTEIRAAASGAAYSLSKLTAALLPFALLPVLQEYGPGALFGVIGAAMTVMAITVLSLGDRTTGAPIDRAVRR